MLASVVPSFIVTVMFPLLYHPLLPFGVSGFIVIVGVAIIPFDFPVVVSIVIFPALSTACTSIV